MTAVCPAFVPLQEVLLRSFPVSLCSSFQGILGSEEAVHQPHHEVGDPGADGHDVGPLVCIWTQTPDRRSHNRRKCCMNILQELLLIYNDENAKSYCKWDKTMYVIAS